LSLYGHPCRTLTRAMPRGGPPVVHDGSVSTLRNRRISAGGQNCFFFFSRPRHEGECAQPQRPVDSLRRADVQPIVAEITLRPSQLDLDTS
jgi:hypothetical protein